ncbi:MAG TPA: hypothetical protein VJ608_03955, partial [Albitalea sp.]|nr:hypothetical protein [Albitalea sp.]
HNAMPRASDRRYLDNRHLAADRGVVAAGVASHVAVCCWLAPGWSTWAGGPALSPAVVVAALVVAPWWIFHVLFSTLTFQHHTHPAVHWVRTKRESSYFAGQVRATVHIELPRWAELWLHHITDHNAHRVDPRIGFRSLPSAQQRIEAAFAEHVIVERWSLGSLIRVTRSCQLYDYEAREWRPFASG